MLFCIVESITISKEELYFQRPVFTILYVLLHVRSWAIVCKIMFYARSVLHAKHMVGYTDSKEL
jgi:hypothetical protein